MEMEPQHLSLVLLLHMQVVAEVALAVLTTTITSHLQVQQVVLVVAVMVEQVLLMEMLEPPTLVVAEVAEVGHLLMVVF